MDVHPLSKSYIESHALFFHVYISILPAILSRFFISGRISSETFLLTNVAKSIRSLERQVAYSPTRTVGAIASFNLP